MTHMGGVEVDVGAVEGAPPEDLFAEERVHPAVDRGREPPAPLIVQIERGHDFDPRSRRCGNTTHTRIAMSSAPPSSLLCR